MNQTDKQASNMTSEPVTVELLSEMYRNVTMGSENLATVVPMIRDKFLLTNVTSQLEKYGDLTNKTANLLKKRAVKPREPTMMKKVMSRGGIAMNTLFDSSDKHIAEMIVKGTKMGVEQLEHKLNDFRSKGCDEDAVKLCRDIVQFEHTEADKMLDYT